MGTSDGTRYACAESSEVFPCSARHPTALGTKTFRTPSASRSAFQISVARRGMQESARPRLRRSSRGKATVFRHCRCRHRTGPRHAAWRNHIRHAALVASLTAVHSTQFHDGVDVGQSNPATAYACITHTSAGKNLLPSSRGKYTRRTFRLLGAWPPAPQIRTGAVRGGCEYFNVHASAVSALHMPRMLRGGPPLGEGRGESRGVT